MKPQTAALGFRVKSGWAAAVLLKGAARSPQLCDVQRIDLSDPRFPETRVRRITEKSIAKLLTGYRQQNFRIKRAALVVGSKIDPASVANPHIRAHAFEGRLFRSVLEKSLQTHRIRTDVLIERDAYREAIVILKQSNENVRRMIQNFGRDTQAPWRAEQKVAAVAAWLALR